MTKVYETKLRSMLKGITARIIEVLVDTLIISMVGVDIKISFVISLVLEGACFVASYINERVWNFTDFGRVVKDD